MACEGALGGASLFRYCPELIRRADPGPLHVNPLMAEDYSEEHVLSSIRELGWEMPKDTGKCSSNCRLNSLGIHTHFTRYGFSPYAREAAELVRTGSMSRERGMEMVEDVHFDENVRGALDRLGISDEEYRARLKNGQDPQ